MCIDRHFIFCFRYSSVLFTVSISRTTAMHLLKNIVYRFSFGSLFSFSFHWLLFCWSSTAFLGLPFLLSNSFNFKLNLEEGSTLECGECSFNERLGLLTWFVVAFTISFFGKNLRLFSTVVNVVDIEYTLKHGKHKTILLSYQRYVADNRCH